MSDSRGYNLGLVSIIIPTFNSGRFLAQTVESVAEQSYRNIEIIIVDDATTDQSILNLNEMIDRDDRIRVISNTGAKGACGARNCGLSHAEGEYVVFHDADDLSLPGRLRKQVEYLLENTDLVGVGSQAYLINGDGKRFGLRSLPLSYSRIVWSEITRPAFSFVHTALMVRRAIFNESGPFDVKLEASQDKALYTSIIDAFRFENMEECLVEYRIHAGQISDTKASIQLSNAKEICISKIRSLVDFSDVETDFVERFIAGKLDLGDVTRYAGFIEKLISALDLAGNIRAFGRAERVKYERNLCYGGLRFHSRFVSFTMAIVLTLYLQKIRCNLIHK